MSELNLNQMGALDALLTECNVRRAAQRVGVTQSAMSHALRQLREALGDPLLVRSGNRMIPTPRAEAIRIPLHHALVDLHAAVATRPRFEPETSQRRFTIACSDAVAVTLIPALARRLARAAPHVALELRDPPDGVAELLESGELDLLISPIRPRAPGMKARALYTSGWTVVCKRRHPHLDRPLDLDLYCELPHAIVGRGRGPGVVDDALGKLGRSRRITLVIPYFMATSAILERTEHLITLPEGLARQLVRGRRLEPHDCPVRLPTGRVHAIWHERFDQEPGARWLREQLIIARDQIAD